jgi:hypothetical protein
METKINLEKTKKNYPALWEWGGSSRNQGESQIICGSNFEQLNPIYNVNWGHRCNGKHSLFIAKEGMHIIHVQQYRNDVEKINVLKILKIEKNTEQDGNELYIAICSVENTFEQGEWDKPIPDSDNFKKAVESAIQKSKCYHCKESHYSLPILAKPV